MQKNWWKKDAIGIPQSITEIPGPKSHMYTNTTKYMKGLSPQVKLFSICFDKGSGITLTDTNGNRYLDFSSGIYVTSLGHCLPKISEAISFWAKRLVNAHDFTTPVKKKLIGKMVSVLPGKLNTIQLETVLLKKPYAAISFLLQHFNLIAQEEELTLIIKNWFDELSYWFGYRYKCN